MREHYEKVSGEIARLMELATSKAFEKIDEMSSEEFEVLQSLTRLARYTEKLGRAMIENEIRQTEMLEEVLDILKKRQEAE